MDTTQVLIIIAAAVAALVVLALVLVARRRQDEPGELSGPPPTSQPGWGAVLRRVWAAGLESDTWEQIEETLIAADMGVEPSARVVATARAGKPSTVEEARDLVAGAILDQMTGAGRGLDLEGSPAVVLVVGVNGSGKTTTIAKLAHRLTTQGRAVTLAAADTFRAAAREQLVVWGRRIGVPVITGQERGDPAAVAHDAISSARARGSDVVIVDTAGRLHSDRNLMEELAKVHRVTGSAARVGEVLLVLDATSGQNGLGQVARFAEAVPVTGVVLTKMDGTARGGIVVAVESRLGVPVKLVGTGESLDDLLPFDPEGFVADLTA